MPGARSTGSTSTSPASEPSGKFSASPSAFYAAIKQACILFDGLVQNTLPRDEVYHFLELGRYLERVNVMGRILHAKCRSHNQGANGGDPPMQLIRWTGLLAKLLGLWRLPARRARPGRAGGRDPVPGLEPRLSRGPSAFAWLAAASRSRRLPAATTMNMPAKPSGLLGRLDSELRYIDVGEIFERGLLPFLDGIQTTCLRVGDEIQRSYFLT